MIVVGVVIFCGLWLLQGRSYMSLLVGLILLSSGINLSIVYGSDPELSQFAFVGGPETPSNDPLPQALTLTAIVIGFALLGFLVALIKRMVVSVGTLSSDAMKRED